MTTHQNHGTHRRPGYEGAGSFSRMIDDLMNTNLSEVFDTAFVARRPFVNVVESDHAIELQVAAPGLRKSDFKLEVKENKLHISAKAPDGETEGQEYRSREFSFHNFEREFRLGEKVDPSKISARYENGILYVTLPKREEETLKREIRVD